MNAVFADTFYFLAMGNPDDDAHAKALALTQTLTAPVVTTAWVLTEVGDASAQPKFRSAFLDLWNQLRANPKITIVPATQSLFERGIDLFAHRLDKPWSLTDCISFVVMTEHRLTDVLTGDHHFEQAGFRALLK